MISKCLNYDILGILKIKSKPFGVESVSSENLEILKNS